MAAVKINQKAEEKIILLSKTMQQEKLGISAAKRKKLISLNWFAGVKFSDVKQNNLE